MVGCHVDGMPTDTTDARFIADVLESDAPVVVDFTAAVPGDPRNLKLSVTYKY